MPDYSDKIVYVGIDVHKKTYAVTCIVDKFRVKKDTLEASPEGLVGYLKKHFGTAKQIITAYEAGFSGFGLHRHLVKNGIENLVVHAGSIEISSRDRVKTDKRDSLKLAVQLSTERLKCIHIPSEEREAARELTRLRESLARDKRRIGNQLKSLLMKHSLLVKDDDKKISLKWLKKIETLECDSSIKYVLQIHIDRWRSLREELKKLDAELDRQAQTDEALESIYRSAPGIGKLHARVLANELGDMKQFSNEKKLSSFTGLTPCEYSSGDHIRQGHISRQGRPLLRKVLIQAAWVAVRQDQSIKIIFERLSNNCGVKRAIIGVARRLICRIRSCFISNTLYQKQPFEEICKESGEIRLVATA